VSCNDGVPISRSAISAAKRFRCARALWAKQTGRENRDAVVMTLKDDQGVDGRSAALAARVVQLGDFARLAELLDNEVVAVVLDYPLGIGSPVTSGDQEPARIGANLLVGIQWH
jgi:hypothetical protein